MEERGPPDLVEKSCWWHTNSGMIIWLELSSCALLVRWLREYCVNQCHCPVASSLPPPAIFLQKFALSSGRWIWECACWPLDLKMCSCWTHRLQRTCSPHASSTSSTNGSFAAESWAIRNCCRFVKNRGLADTSTNWRSTAQIWASLRILIRVHTHRRGWFWSVEHPSQELSSSWWGMVSEWRNLPLGYFLVFKTCGMAVRTTWGETWFISPGSIIQSLVAETRILGHGTKWDCNGSRHVGCLQSLCLMLN